MKRHGKGKSQNHKLAKRLATYAVGVAGATGLAAQADAAVVPVTFGFGSTWENTDQTSGNRTSFDVTGPSGSLGRIGCYTSSYFGAIGGGGYWSAGASNTPNAFVYGDGVQNNGNPGSKIAFLTVGTVIGTGLNGTPGTATAGMATMHWRDHNGQPAYELAVDIDDFYFGFKTNDGYYGWANAGYIANYNFYGQLIIKSAYVEDVLGDPITVGDTGIPEPTTLALLAAGAAGLVKLRRRNGAAS